MKKKKTTRNPSASLRTGVALVRLSPLAVEGLLEEMDQTLTKADYEHVKGLLKLFQKDGDFDASYVACLNQQSPGKPEATQQSNFRAFRSRVAKAAREAGLELRIEVDTLKDAERKTVWIVGRDRTEIEATHLSQAASRSSVETFVETDGHRLTEGNSWEYPATPVIELPSRVSAKNRDRRDAEESELIGTERDAQLLAEHDDSVPCYQETDGATTRLDQLSRETPSLDRSGGSGYERLRGGSQSVLRLLDDWAEDAGSAPYAAVLGEYGIGKTTNLKEWTQRRLKNREQHPEQPLVLFIDLRHHIDGQQRSAIPTLNAVLQASINTVSRGEATADPGQHSETGSGSRSHSDL
ncbi:MAG: hypothetical protein R3C49_03310 [Planctomycetaceae bacterium]